MGKPALRAEKCSDYKKVWRKSLPHVSHLAMAASIELASDLQT